MRNLINMPSPLTLLLEKVERLRHLHREREELDKRYNALKKEITDAIGDTTEIKNQSGVTVATYTFEKSTSFNKAAFEASYPGVYEQFAVVGTKRVFRFK